jgi:stearoyl-CoA desaturase (Delta-9 desaturase)
MPAILIFFIAHWYLTIFVHTFFLHRYAAHQHWTLSKPFENAFHVFSWLVTGSAYLSPYAYGIMHRIHHAYTDTEKDPHSPAYHGNIFNMMWQTRTTYFGIWKGTIPVDEKFKKGVPHWPAFEAFAHHYAIRITWIALYVLIYTQLVTAPWQWAFLPVTIVMSAFHGAIINWFSHRVGYVNYKMNNTSTNLMPVDFFFLGEMFHNNHHKAPSRPNLGFRKFEFDPLWPIVVSMEKLRLIRINRVSTPPPAIDGPGYKSAPESEPKAA